MSRDYHYLTFRHTLATHNDRLSPRMCFHRLSQDTEDCMDLHVQIWNSAVYMGIAFSLQQNITSQHYVYIKRHSYIQIRCTLAHNVPTTLR